MLRYAAHLSIAFKEYPFYERFQRAADLGFSAVEFMSPFDYDVDQVIQAAQAAGVQVVQYNFFNGDLAAGDRGFASHPDRQAEWREWFLRALELVPRFPARQLTALAGCALPGLDRETQVQYLVENCQWAAEHLAKVGVPMTLEALNPCEH